MSDAASNNPFRVVLIPQVDTYDVFVEEETDYRYYVNLTKQVAAHRGVPLVAQCVLKRAPVSDPVYDIPVPGAM